TPKTPPRGGKRQGRAGFRTSPDASAEPRPSPAPLRPGGGNQRRQASFWPKYPLQRRRKRQAAWLSAAHGKPQPAATASSARVSRATVPSTSLSLSSPNSPSRKVEKSCPSPTCNGTPAATCTPCSTNLRPER